MSLKVKRLDEASAAAWDDFVASHKGGTFCHRAGWKTAIEQGVGHECPFLFAEQDGAIVGVLPLTVRKSRLFGNAAVSTMFGVYGGPLTDTREGLDALETAAIAIARENDCALVEYRSRKAHHALDADWVVETDKAATFIKQFESNDSDNLLLEVPRKQRAVIRKSLKKNMITNWKKDINLFYNLYALSVRNLGTPVFSRRLFEALLKAFGDDVLIQITCDQEGTPVASLLSFLDHKAVLPYYAGGGTKARELHAHDFMYFELMKEAVARGRMTFDFGRSKVGTGAYNFKKNWGFNPTPLEYQYYLLSGNEMPDNSPQNPKYQAMIAVWKHLPIWLANKLGPPIARHLG